MRTSLREAGDSVPFDQRTLQAPRGGSFGASPRRLRRSSIAASSPSESWVSASQTHHEGFARRDRVANENQEGRWPEMRQPLHLARLFVSTHLGCTSGVYSFHIGHFISSAVHRGHHFM